MKILRLNPYFFFPFILALISGAVILLSTEKGEVLLLINQRHNAFFDQLFYYGTSVGNGLLYIVVIIVLACIRFRLALLALICFSLTGTLTQVLKKIVFSNSVRPKMFFEGVEPLHFVDGVKIFSYNSFPSGHTAIAFSLFCLLSLIIPQKKYGLLLITFALIGGVSRIYLVQHFFVDVYVGSILGVLVTVLAYYYLDKAKWLNANPALEKNLFGVVSKMK